MSKIIVFWTKFGKQFFDFFVHWSILSEKKLWFDMIIKFNGLVSIFMNFWRQNLEFCTRIFFPKILKKIDFFEHPKSMTYFPKKPIFLKNTRVTLIFDDEKIKIHVPRPIIFIKKHKKWPFFCADGSKKGIEKNWNFESQIIISRSNYEKKVDFVHFFSKKIDFFHIFFKKLTFFYKIHDFSNVTRISTSQFWKNFEEKM